MYVSIGIEVSYLKRKRFCYLDSRFLGFNQCWAIKVRVCRLWESLNSKKSGELISLEMVFIDEMVCPHCSFGQWMYKSFILKCSIYEVYDHLLHFSF